MQDVDQFEDGIAVMIIINSKKKMVRRRRKFNGWKYLWSAIICAGPPIAKEIEINQQEPLSLQQQIVDGFAMQIPTIVKDLDFFFLPFFSSLPLPDDEEIRDVEASSFFSWSSWFLLSPESSSRRRYKRSVRQAPVVNTAESYSPS